QGREDVEEVNRIIGISMEVRAAGEARSGDPVEHRPIPQHRQVERGAVECDEPRLQLGNTGDEGSDQLSLSALADMGSSESDHFPWTGNCRAPSDQRSNTHDGVKEMLRELLTQRIADQR